MLSFFYILFQGRENARSFPSFYFWTNSLISYYWSIDILPRADVVANIVRAELKMFRRYLLQLD
jgi:hypothetical protein